MKHFNHTPLDDVYKIIRVIDLDFLNMTIIKILILVIMEGLVENLQILKSQNRSSNPPTSVSGCRAREK